MTAKTTLAAALILGLGLLGGGISAFAQEENDPLASLTARWRQYANSIPTTVNPLVDSTGADCNVGQRDPVWFLTGTFFGGTADRTCAIPEGEWLFFPVINSVDFNTPGVCGQNGSLDVPTLRALSAAFIDGATKLTVQVDGKTVKGSRACQVGGFCDDHSDGQHLQRSVRRPRHSAGRSIFAVRRMTDTTSS